MAPSRSMGWWNQTALLIVFIKAAAGLAPEISRVHVLLEQRAGTILVVAEHPMHHLHDREAGVEPDQVGQLERPHRLIGAEFYRGVDIGYAANPFVECVNRFVDHRQQHAIYDEAREILRSHRGLAELLRQPASLLEGRFGSREAADNFDQLHRGNRIHEMHPDYTIGAAGPRTHPR